jgi:hypothetical protein
MVINAGTIVKTSVAQGATIANDVTRVGITNELGTTTQPVSGVWWEADSSTQALWQYCYGNGTTATCAPATSHPVTASTFARLEIKVTAVGAGTSAATFTIDNQTFTVSGVTINSTTRLAPMFAQYTSTTAAREGYIDYFQVRTDFGSPR